MKALIFLLVLANVLFFAYTEGYFGHPDNADAARVEQQISPERIKIIARGEPPGDKPAAAAPRPEPVPPPAEEPKPAVAEEAKKMSAAPEAAPAPAKPEPEPAPPANACLAWNNLSAAEADRLSALLAEKFDHFRQSRRLVAAEGSSWWVYIPPLPTKADAEKKAGELKNLGVSEYFIIQDAGPNRYALSLGVFSVEAGARDRLAELKAKGVKSAKAGPRPGKDATQVLQATGPAANVAALRKAVAGVLPKVAAEECP